MHASDVMSSPVISVHRDTTAIEAVTLLTEHGFAALPVVDDKDQVVGIFSESDALAGGWPPLSRVTTVASLMSTPVEVATPDTDVAELARRILADRVRSIPIVQHGVLVGIVSRRDILRPLVRRDDVIAAAAQALLAQYSGYQDRWGVSVHAGMAIIRGEFTDEAERGVVAALVRTVPGVIGTELHAERRTHARGPLR